jgi:hypothetical protein
MHTNMCHHHHQHMCGWQHAANDIAPKHRCCPSNETEQTARHQACCAPYRSGAARGRSPDCRLLSLLHCTCNTTCAKHVQDSQAHGDICAKAQAQQMMRQHSWQAKSTHSCFKASRCSISAHCGAANKGTAQHAAQAHMQLPFQAQARAHCSAKRMSSHSAYTSSASKQASTLASIPQQQHQQLHHSMFSTSSNYSQHLHPHPTKPPVVIRPWPSLLLSHHGNLAGRLLSHLLAVPVRSLNPDSSHCHCTPSSQGTASAAAYAAAAKAQQQASRNPQPFSSRQAA